MKHAQDAAKKPAGRALRSGKTLVEPSTSLAVAQNQCGLNIKKDSSANQSKNSKT